MSFQLSDSDSRDSDVGVRYKTESIRNIDYLEKDASSDSQKCSHQNKIKKHSTLAPDEIGPSVSVNKDAPLQSEDLFGPALPPHLQDKNKSEMNTDDSTDKDASGVSPLIGPSLPPNLKQKFYEENLIGPALPPHLKKEEAEKPHIIGPALPPGFKRQSTEEPEETCPPVTPLIDPLPQKKFRYQAEIYQDEEHEIYGPIIPGIECLSRSHFSLEERAWLIKLGQLGASSSSNVASREQWMLELPENRASNIGLGPRQFKAKAGPDMSDRSCWTDTPKDKERKLEKNNVEEKINVKASGELIAMAKRDKQQEEIAKKHKRKSESLVEIHQKKLKEKKAKEGPSERRPFNRETDLQVNRFDEAQKKAVLKKAQLLDDRFSRGQSKFL